MVTKKLTLTVVLMGLLVSVFLSAPAYSSDAAGQDNLSNITGRVCAALKPVMDMNNVTVAVVDDVVVKSDISRLEERLMNLLSNALVHAPAGTQIQVSYDGTSNQLKLWVENLSVSHTIKREVVDAMGNTFILETMSGKGTQYAINL